MHGENCWQGWGRLVGADDVVSIVDRMCTHKPSKNGGKNVDIYSYVAIEPYNLAGKDRMYSYVYLAGNSRTSAASILHVAVILAGDLIMMDRSLSTVTTAHQFHHYH